MSLEDIKARAADCQSYNFGMRNADKLAHEDVPKLVAALEAALEVCDNWDRGVQQLSAGEARGFLTGAAFIVRTKIAEALSD